MYKRIVLCISLLVLGSIALACAPAPTAVPPTSAPAATKPASSSSSVASSSSVSSSSAAPSSSVSSPSVASSSSAAASSKPLRHVVYGSPVTPPNLVHLAPYVAQDMGFFKEVGLEVEFKTFEGGIGALRGMVSGGLDIAGTSSDALIAATAQGVQVHAIGTYAPKLSQVIVSTADVKTIADLKGKKMGIQEVGGFADVMNQLLLSSAGMKKEDVTSVSVTTAGRVAALVTGQINAHALHADQYYTALKQKPDLVTLAKMWEVAPKWWYAAFAAPDDAVKKNPDLYIDFMTAVIKAQRFMYANKDKTVEIGIKYTKLDPEAVSKGYDDLAKGGIWSVNDGMPKDFVQYTIDKKFEMGAIDKKPTYEQVVDLSIVNEAIKRNGGPMTGDPRWY